MEGRGMRKKRSYFFLFVCICAALFCAVACSQKEKDEKVDIPTLLAKESLTQTEQQTLARALFEEMIEADEGDIEIYERNYKAVLEKCPDTEQAHTAVWRLSNLYTLAFDEPQYEKLVAILEPFLERYTESNVVSMEKYPEEILVFSPLAKLHQSYEQLGRQDKIIAYYEKAIAEGKELGHYDCLDYAEALYGFGRRQDSLPWYQAFLKKSDGLPDVEISRELAEARIKTITSKDIH